MVQLPSIHPWPVCEFTSSTKFFFFFFPALFEVLFRSLLTPTVPLWWVQRVTLHYFLQTLSTIAGGPKALPILVAYLRKHCQFTSSTTLKMACLHIFTHCTNGKLMRPTSYHVSSLLNHDFLVAHGETVVSHAHELRVIVQFVMERSRTS